MSRSCSATRSTAVSSRSPNGCFAASRCAGRAGSTTRDRERVVQLVGAAGQQAAHCGQLLALAQGLALALDLARRGVHLGHVDHLRGVEGGAPHVGAPQHHLDRELGAVGAQRVQLHARAEHARRAPACMRRSPASRASRESAAASSLTGRPSTSARRRWNIASADGLNSTRRRICWPRSRPCCAERSQATGAGTRAASIIVRLISP
jgi:hypothetical protein